MVAVSSLLNPNDPCASYYIYCMLQFLHIQNTSYYLNVEDPDPKRTFKIWIGIWVRIRIRIRIRNQQFLIRIIALHLSNVGIPTHTVFKFYTNLHDNNF